MAALMFVSAASGATFVTYSQGALFISGDDQRNLLTVSIDGTAIRVADSGTNGVFGSIPGCTPVDPRTTRCQIDPPDPLPPSAPEPPITTLSASLFGGDDSLANQTPLGTPVLESPQSDLTLNGGLGNDVIRGGSAAETIIGGVGQDTVDGGGGDDKLINTDESLFFDEFFRYARGELDGSSDSYIGGIGDDVTRFDAREDNLTITLDGVANDGRPGENDNVMTESVVGGSGPDSITGDGFANTLIGGPGNDFLGGRGRADRLEGGRGNDSLVGGRARDQLRCDSGFDLAISKPIDDVAKDCERTGAKLGSDTGQVRRGTTLVWIACPSQEGARCRGNVNLRLNGKKIAGGSFRVKRGAVKRFAAALNRRGRSVMRRNRSVLVSALVRTKEPLGRTVEREQLLLTR